MSPCISSFLIYLCHFNARRHLIDEDLLKHPCLWPEVDEHLESLKQACVQKGKVGPYSKYHLVRFLSQIRRSFLQDLPLLMLDDPNNDTWKMCPEFFGLPEFKAWQKRLVDHVQHRNTARAEESVRDNQPAVARSINHTFGRVADQLNEQRHESRAQHAEVLQVICKPIFSFSMYSYYTDC